MKWFNRTATAGKAFILVALAYATLTLHPIPLSADHEKDEGDDDRDQVALSFSTVGDSRQDPKKFDSTTSPLSSQDKIWLQNTKAWSRIMRSIQAQKSDLLFFNGDMIMGYGNATIPLNAATVDGVIGSDLMKFYRQYGFWRGMVANLMETGTYVVPVPGNHETQCNDAVSESGCGGVSGKHAMQENEEAWRQNMGDLILDDTRFQNLFGEKPSYEATGDNRSATDGLTTDQTQLYLQL